MRIFLTIILLLISTKLVIADNIFYNKSTGEIMTISKDIVILSDSDKSLIISKKLPDNFDINTLPRSLKYYTYDGSKIVLNTKKISDEETAQVGESQKKIKEEADQQSTVKKLKGLGFTDDEIKVVIK